MLAGAGRARSAWRAPTRRLEALRVIHEAAPLLWCRCPQQHSGRDERSRTSSSGAPRRKRRSLTGSSCRSRSTPMRLSDQRHVVRATRRSEPKYRPSARRRPHLGAVARGGRAGRGARRPSVRAIHGYLDFRQSRVERMAQNCEIADAGASRGPLPHRRSRALASVEAKAVQGDLVFLRFLAQRGRSRRSGRWPPSKAPCAVGRRAHLAGASRPLRHPRPDRRAHAPRLCAANPAPDPARAQALAGLVRTSRGLSR